MQLRKLISYSQPRFLNLPATRLRSFTSRWLITPRATLPRRRTSNMSSQKSKGNPRTELRAQLIGVGFLSVSCADTMRAFLFERIRANYLSALVFSVRDLFHPIDCLSVEGFSNSDVSHRRCRRCAMPVFLAGRDPH